MRLVRLLANLGYGSQKDVRALLRDGRVTARDGARLAPDSKVAHDDLMVDGETLDPPQGVVLMLNKPDGYTCSTSDPGRVVYELLPPRFARRNPVIAPVGRLDRDTTGLLLLTDDGALLHKIISPKSRIPKTYDVTLADPLAGTEADLFASGTLMLRSEKDPLLPASLEVLGDCQARLTIVEGRYHQVKRMFAAAGNRVETLHRSRIGGLELGVLQPGEWRVLTPEEVEAVFR
ncbi:MAG TPA: pseudouridine synthase [Candidatus Omnitrophota bacterium]|nr:pseudouridine synthase [Candidatus Omnitrophota bacterium]